MSNKKIDVFIGNRLVGTMAETSDMLIAFQYSDEWIKSGFEISPFSLPLEKRVFVPKESSREVFGGMFGVFADSLPDAWGELLLDRFLRTIGIDPDGLSVLDRLAYVGKSGMGALEYHPVKESSFSVGDLSYDTIAEECEKLISSKQSNHIKDLYNLGGSSGGTRPKILVRKNNKDYIVKFPGKSDPSFYGKMEYDYSLCAKKCNIEMTDTFLITSKTCDGYFMTERFDRSSGNKIFTSTFSGILDVDFRAPTCDYSTYMKLVQILTKENIRDIKQLFRRMCFNVLSHNRDDHTKNFSMIYTDQYGWRLSPAYDITYSNTYFGEQTTTVNRKGKDITMDDIISTGITAGLSDRFCRDAYLEIKNNVESDLSEYLNGLPPAKRKTNTKSMLGEL